MAPVSRPPSPTIENLLAQEDARNARDASPPRAWRVAGRGVTARTLAMIDGAGVGLGALVPIAGVLGPALDGVRLSLVILSFTMLVLRFALVRRDLADAHPLVVVAPASAAVLAACWGAAVQDTHALSLAILAGFSCATGLVSEVLVSRARLAVLRARERIESGLDVSARVVRGDQTIQLPAIDVRPGEQVVVEAGETVGVDGVVAGGEARVVPWLDAEAEVVKREGEPIVAGARVVASRLRLTTTWSGRERAWLKLLVASALRVDVGAPTARRLRVGMERGAAAAGVLLGLAAYGASARPLEIFAAACAGAMAFGARGIASFVALHFARAHLDALACGITYKDPRAFERAGTVDIAVLSAHGTVLMGEPEIVAVEPIGAAPVERVLALAAGAETASSHPFAAAILRAARVRGIAPDPVRNATAHAGLGVTASASTGERLIVGGRAIMLEEKIGIAAVDAHIAELETLGRSVLLVALGDRLLGLIALMDGLRPGARAAVQRLLDVHVEPALLSGEARETCETLARALDIEHVRPEVLPADRATEVRALAEGGSVVAAVGHAVRDDGVLGAAEVAIAMGAAGSSPGEWGVALASDDIRDAASALSIPHRARERAKTALALGAAPPLVALLSIGFGIASPAVAPIGVLIGVFCAAVHAHQSLTSP